MPDFDVVESYRGGRADDDFDLPRFQPRTSQRDVRPGGFGHVSSPTGPRLNPAYSGSGQQLSSYQPPVDNGSMGSSVSQRQHPSRLSQILDVDVFGGAGSLARSTSLGGMTRGRHGNHPPDDVERAFGDLPPPNGRMVPQQQQSPPSQSFYNSSITYQNTPSTQGDAGRAQIGDPLPYPTRRSTTHSGTY